MVDREGLVTAATVGGWAGRAQPRAGEPSYNRETGQRGDSDGRLERSGVCVNHSVVCDSLRPHGL